MTTSSAWVEHAAAEPASSRRAAHGIDYLTVKTPIVGPQGNIVGLSGVSIDITESERFEQALKESQQFLGTILDSVDGYIYTKSQDHRYTYTNRAAAALFQRTPEDLVGMQDSELLPEVVRHVRASDEELVFSRGESRPPRCSCRPPTEGCATSG